MGIEFCDLGHYTQNWNVGCIVFAISCFDWVMIILYLLQKLRLKKTWICLAWDWRSLLLFLLLTKARKEFLFRKTIRTTVLWSSISVNCLNVD